MQIERYSRQIAPSEPISVPDYLNHEHLKLERSIDSIRTGLGNIRPAIADDASGLANQATVNAILAALRAYGILLP